MTRVAVHRAFNFNAGPAALPLPVLERARAELTDYQGTGLSVMEMSHRSREFERILASAETRLRRTLDVPDSHAVLFLQGGGSLQFAMAPMNLAIPGHPVEVLHTGTWTQKALEELQKLADSDPAHYQFRLAASTEKERFRRLPYPSEIHLGASASYVYLASNNTIEGTQWQQFPSTGEVPLVADMSSDILSRRIDVSRFGLLFAGAQKNLGASGVTVVVIRKDLLPRAPKSLPAILTYAAHEKAGSLYHTPPTFAIHILDLVVEWVEGQGGVSAFERRNDEKARCLYSAIDASSYFQCPVDPADRSSMNVVIRIAQGRQDLEKQFVSEAADAGLLGLEGHRSVGGLRASLYNAVPLEAVHILVAFMKDFARRNPL